MTILAFGLKAIGRPRINYKRICCVCGSDKTFVHKNGREQWYRQGQKYLCHRCKSRLISNKITNKKWNPINNPKDVYFINKTIKLKENPRKGKCILCDSNGRTHMHHIKYNHDNPLKDTIEVCVACHTRIHIGKICLL